MPIRFGANPIGWSNDDMPELGGDTPLEQCLSEAKQVGFEGMELGNKFPRDAAALRKVLAAHGLDLISGWYSGALALSHLTPLNPRQGTLLICLIGFLLAATRFDQQLLPFLGYLGAALGPALALVLLVNWRQPPHRTTLALLAWLVGAGVAVTPRRAVDQLEFTVGQEPQPLAIGTESRTAGVVLVARQPRKVLAIQ